MDKRRLGIGLITLALGTAAATPVTVPMPAPLTGSAAGIGTNIRGGAAQCFGQVKAQLAGKDLELNLRVFDDAGDTDAAKKALAQLQSDPSAVALLTGSVSGVAFAITETLKASPMGTVAALTGANVFTDRELPFVNRVSVRSDVVFGLGAEFAAQSLDAKNAYLLDDGSVYGKDFSATLKAALPKNAIKLAGSLSSGDVNTLAAVAKEVRSRGADTVFMGFNDPGLAGSALKALRAGGFSGYVLGGVTFTDPNFVTNAGDARLGMYQVAGYGPLTAYSSAKGFVADYTTQTGAVPTAYALQGCDAARMIGAAIARATVQRGQLPGREAVIAALRRVNIAGMTGTVSFNRRGDRRTNTVYVLQYGTDGVVRLVAGQQMRGGN